jgi:hypothetical protein
MVLTGSFIHAARFGDQTIDAQTETYTAYLVTMDENAKVLWARAYPDTASQFGTGIAVRKNKIIWMGGYYSGLDLGTDKLFIESLLSGGHLFLAEYDKAGDL